MKKTILCIILMIVAAFSFALAGCGPAGGDNRPVANAELDEYNQIISQMKDVFTQEPNEAEPMSARVGNSPSLFSSYQQTPISNMFSIMEADSSKEESEDADYYAYGIDFSTMTARIAGYAANHYFKLASFYDVNILMDYGGNTVINACVQKEGNTIKTYLFTNFKNTRGDNFSEYNYAEINFTSQTDFNILVIDYVYDAEDNNTSKTMIYASSNKDFFLMSGDVDNAQSGTLFFNRGGNNSAFIIQGRDSDTIHTLFNIMDENFALSSQDKDYIGSLYNNQRYSINFKQVTEAKTKLGVIIDMEDEEYVAPIGFVSNKNAQDMVGRKTLQAFVDDGQTVVNKTLTIPKEFNYLSGGIYFDADVDTLVIPSSIKGVVVYDRLWNYTILDDSLCYFDAGDNYEDGRYRAWGGSLASFVSDQNGEFWINNTKPFKRFILLDDTGAQTTETDAFVLDEVGNLWIKDSNGNKNYLWGFVSEPLGDTIYLPSPTYTTKGGRYIEVEHFTSQGFLEGLKNIGKQDEYTSHFKHAIIDGYMIEDYIPEMGIQPGFKLLRNSFFVSFEYNETGVVGLKWDLETLTINNIPDGEVVNLYDVFCCESSKTDSHGNPVGGTVCQTKIKKVILNGDFDTITYSNGYTIFERQPMAGGNGTGQAKPDGGIEITGTYAISEDYELNGRENAHFSHDSVVYGKKVVEIYGDQNQLPVFPDAETLLIKSSVRDLSIYQSLLQLGMYQMPEDRKLTIEFENIAGIDFGSFYIHDFMGEGSTRVEKIKFNASEMYIENIIQRLMYSPNAFWLEEAVNLSGLIIEYADPLEGEEEFFSDFSFDESGNVWLNEYCTNNYFEIDDAFLTLIKQMTGKDLSQVNINFYSAEQVKVVLNISKEFLDENGQIPLIAGMDIVEIESDMKDYDDLTAILDRIEPYEGGKLIFNGTQQELIERSGDLGADYIGRLLYIQSAYYGEISFSNGQTIYRDITNKTVTYEDERIKITAVFENDDNRATRYRFEDKSNEEVWFVSSSNYDNGYDQNNGNTYWAVTVHCEIDNLENSVYGDKEVWTPVYKFTILYQYGYENGVPVYIRGTGDEDHYTVQFKLFMMPDTITLS